MFVTAKRLLSGMVIGAGAVMVMTKMCNGSTVVPHLSCHRRTKPEVDRTISDVKAVTTAKRPPHHRRLQPKAKPTGSKMSAVSEVIVEPKMPGRELSRRENADHHDPKANRPSISVL